MIDGRLITLGTLGRVYTVTKRPNEIYHVDINTARWLPGVDIDTTSAPTVAPAGLTATVAGGSGSITQIALSGGTGGTTYTVTSVITFMDGTAREIEIAVTVIATPLTGAGSRDSANGLYLRAGGVGKKGLLTKQVNDVFFVTVDYGEWLHADDAISTLTAPTAAATPSLDAPTLAITRHDTYVTLEVSAGANGYSGVILVTATTLFGEKKEYEIDVQVTNT